MSTWSAATPAATKPAKFVVVLLKKKGAPVLTPGEVSAAQPVPTPSRERKPS